MTYATAEARQQLLDEIGRSIDELSAALAALGTAYELLDVATADRLEAALFQPVQAAYGRARKTHSGFATRHNLPTRTFSPAESGAPSRGVHAFVEAAVDAVSEADEILAELQDSMAPVEVGDAELRAGLAEVRERIGDIEERAHLLSRTIGR